VFDTTCSDAACLADALRVACCATRTPPRDASVAYHGEPERTWLVAAALAGVHVLPVSIASFSASRVVALLADGAPWPVSAIEQAHAAAQALGVMLILDAPAALVDEEALAELTALDDTLVVVTAGAARDGEWAPRITTRASVVPLPVGTRPRWTAGAVA
jgi:hypothetical protein